MIKLFSLIIILFQVCCGGHIHFLNQMYLKSDFHEESIMSSVLPIITIVMMISDAVLIIFSLDLIFEAIKVSFIRKPFSYTPIC